MIQNDFCSLSTTKNLRTTLPTWIFLELPDQTDSSFGEQAL